MITSIDIQTKHLQNPIFISDKAVHKLGIEENSLNFTKDIYKKLYS